MKLAEGGLIPKENGCFGHFRLSFRGEELPTGCYPESGLFGLCHLSPAAKGLGWLKRLFETAVVGLSFQSTG